MKKLVLCSGGFDSITMLYQLVKIEKMPVNDIYLLFFDYGQRSLKREEDCVWRAVFDLDIPVENMLTVKLPPFSWDKSSLTNVGVENEATIEGQYMPMRNMIFFSYALSVAQGLECDTVYSAILGGGTYDDTKTEFLSKIWSIAKNIGIDFQFPYAEFDKFGLAGMARMCGITKRHFFSCNIPDENGEPCGKCPDCLAVKDIIHYYLEDNYPKQVLTRNNIKYTSEYKTKYMDYPLEEVRMLINNQCNTQCTHCFYGFEKMVKEELSPVEWKMLINQATTMNPKMNFHFSGKEPFFDKFIFELADYIDKVNACRHTQLTYDVVTNGINVPKYIDEIVKRNFTRVCLSVDYEGCTRSFGGTEEVIKLLVKHRIPVHCFIVAHQDNVDKIPEMIQHLHTLGVQHFFIKDVIDIGHGSNMPLLSTQQYNDLYEAIQNDDYISENTDIVIIFYVKGRHFWNMHQKYTDLPLARDIEVMIKSNDCWFDNVILEVEYVCGRYLTQISVTPDGYVLGCGTELANPNYPDFSSGRFDADDDNSLVKLLNAGRLEALDKIEKSNCENCRICFHKSDMTKYI